MLQYKCIILHLKNQRTLKPEIMKKLYPDRCKLVTGLGVISIYLIGMTVVALQLRSIL